MNYPRTKKAFNRRWQASVVFMRRMLVVSCSLIMFLTSSTSALPAAQKRVIQSGSDYFNVKATEFCTAPTGATDPVNGASLKSGDTVYMLGDSITNGAAQKYRDAFSAPTVGVTAFINANGGRAWRYPGSGSSGAYTPEAGGAQSGRAAVEADGDTIASSAGIIIALGSNDSLNANPISEIITAIQAKNPTAPIWWVNVVASDNNTYPTVTRYGEFNATLQQEFDATGVPTIIDWHNAVIPGSNVSDVPTNTVLDPNNYLTSDGLHPTGTGQDALVSLVTNAVTQVGGGGGTVPDVSGCSCTPGAPDTEPGTPEENYQNTWNFFVTEKHLSPEAAAGIMGNLEAESGINPQNTQNDARDPSGNPVPDGPEIPIDLIRGRYGYGIAQWTSAGRQQNLVDFAAGPPARSTGDLGLQLDFLWQELSTSYTGVLAKLQEPGVTLDEASDEVILRFEIPEAVLPPPRSTPERRQAALVARRALGLAIFNTYSGRPAGSFGNSTCASNTVVDLTDTDTTDVECAPGTTENGDVNAYNNGVEARIKLCTAAGFQVNSQISGPINALVAAANSAGVHLMPGEGFRTMQGQIDVYNKFCEDAGVQPTPEPYPKPTIDAYADCPGGAPPGYSNHQMGFAIDFTCDGAAIPQSFSLASSNPCYVWLAANAANYGMLEWGKGANRESDGYEAWHWSVDGT